MTLLIEPKLSPDQEECKEVLAQAYDLAVEGKIHGVAIVVCLDGGWANLVGGGRPGDLNLGLDDLKHKIRDAVLNAPKNKSSIIKVRN